MQCLRWGLNPQPFDLESSTLPLSHRAPRYQNVKLIPITIDMVKKAISNMKSGKAAGPSGIVVEMIKAAGDTGATMIRDLATAIICDGKVPILLVSCKVNVKPEGLRASLTLPETRSIHDSMNIPKIEFIS